MTAAVDKRDYLVSLGLAKPGRGKFSNAAKEALVEAEKNGISFVDKKATTTVVKTMVDGEIVEEKREVNIFAPHPEPIREGDILFTGADGFKLKVSVKEACHTCNFSLGWCYCSTPMFLHWRNGEVLTYGGNV